MHSEFTNIPPFVLTHEKTYHVRRPAREVRQLDPKRRTEDDAIAQLESRIRYLEGKVRKQADKLERTVPAHIAAPGSATFKAWPPETLYGQVSTHLEAYERSGRSPGFLYIVLSAEGLVKVGVSRIPRERLSQARAWNPSIRVLAVLATRDMYGVERAIHQKFVDKRTGGEWFQLTEADVLEIIGEPVAALERERKEDE